MGGAAVFFIRSCQRNRSGSEQLKKELLRINVQSR
jgi:hypothetical protein